MSQKKLLRSDFNVPFIGATNPVLRKNVVPSVKEVLQVLFHLQRVDKLSLAQCISKVIDSLLSMTVPGFEFKAKFHITRQLKKIVKEWQDLQRNMHRASMASLKQRQAFIEKIGKELDCVKPQSNEAKINKKRTFAMVNDSDKCEFPEPKKKRIRKHNIISPNVAAALERTGTSNRKASIIFTALIKDKHMKLEEESSYSISHRTIRLTRQKRRKEIAEEIKRDFKPNVALTVHWDSKLLPNIISGKKQDRLPILVTGEGTSKLLAVPALERGTAAVEAAAIEQAITDWNLKKKIAAMSFDTTNTNSGCRNGVITLLPAMLQKPLLSLACRHHVAEIVLKHCFEIQGDISQSDKLDKFKRFREDYNERMDSFATLHHRDVTSVPLLAKLTKPWRQNTIEFCLAQLAEQQPRGDYVEFLELVVLFLGGNTPKGIRFRRAGSISRTRWMARAIYVLKIWLLRDQFKNFDDITIDHYEKLCIFISKIYIKYWFSLNNPITAPRIDIEFWRSMTNFEYPDYGETGAKAFENHLWYISPRNIALAFFDDAVTTKEKNAMRKAYLSQVGASSTTTYNKPKKCEATPTRASGIKSSSKLSSFVTPNTKEFFEILQISTDFMKQSPNNWNKIESYHNAKKRVASLVVVNDVAERGVKLISDFNAKSTRDPEQQQYLLQVIEQHRNEYPTKY